MTRAPDTVEFENTADPNCVVTEDVARWCEELAAFIRETPDTWLWVLKARNLMNKIHAANVLAKAIIADETAGKLAPPDTTVEGT
jgi:hypothetical protein